MTEVTIAGIQLDQERLPEPSSTAILAVYGNISAMEHNLRSLQTTVSTKPLRAGNQLPQLFFPSPFPSSHGG